MPVAEPAMPEHAGRPCCQGTSSVCGGFPMQSRLVVLEHLHVRPVDSANMHGLIMKLGCSLGMHLDQPWAGWLISCSFPLAVCITVICSLGRRPISWKMIMKSDKCFELHLPARYRTLLDTLQCSDLHLRLSEMALHKLACGCMPGLLEGMTPLLMTNGNAESDLQMLQSLAATWCMCCTHRAHPSRLTSTTLCSV